MKKQIISGIFILLSLCGYAQEPSLFFERVSTETGLSHNKVNCILQDKRGFIWIGTDDGLNRYDGRNFETFRNVPGDSTTITGNIITGMLEDENELMWIATADGGLSSYDYRLPPRQQFRQFKNRPGDPNSNPANILNDLLDDHRGNLWIASSGESILKFEKSTQRFSKPMGDEGTQTILSLCMDAQGKIWAGRQGGGILKLDPVTLQTEEDLRYRDLYAVLPHAAVTSLFRDKNGNIWYGSWDRVLYRFNTHTGQEEPFSAGQPSHSYVPDEATCFQQDNRGRIWIGGRDKGLQVFDEEAGIFYHYTYDPAREGTLADNHVNCIYIDKNGRVWIGTDKGVSISIPFKRQFVQTFLLPESRTPQKLILYDMYEDEQSRMWIGTSEGLFIREPGGLFVHRPLVHKGLKLSVTCIFRDAGGDVYLGTNNSLFRYDVSRDQLMEMPDLAHDLVMNPIIDSRVVSILRDTIEDHPVLLVSPYGHYITYYDLVEKKWISRLDSSANIIERFNLQDNLVRKFVRGQGGTIWLATAKKGLGKWDPADRRISYFTNIPGDETSIASNDISDIREDAKQNLWVSTYGGGLHYFDTHTNRFRHIGASNNLVEGIQLDRVGNVWMISNGNLQKYDPKKNSITNYDLPDLEKSGGVSGNIFKDKVGRMYVSGDGYYIRFHPDSIRGRQALPSVHFTNFSIFNNSYSHLLYQDEINLGYRQNYFTIEFSAPDFSLSGQVAYSYKLEGFDRDWIDLGTRNYVSYSNLDGSHYTFKVRATNTPGVWNQEVATLKINIRPPFWKQLWFFTLCAVFIASIVYVIYRYRINELLTRQEMRNKIAQDLHDSVGSTLSSISVYSQVARIQHEKNQGRELEDTLQKIGETSGEMISEMSDIVWAINPRNDEMEKILQRMESFARPLLKTKNISCAFNYDYSVLRLNLPMDARKNFYLIFKEAINNVIKYSECRQMDVNLKYNGHLVELEVKDDGKGFDTEEIFHKSSKSLSGNGLMNMQRRAAEMKGTCTIYSEKGRGTLIHLQFPVT